jgi:transposase
MGKLSMRKISEILRQKFDLNRTNRDIARSLNLSASTISDYISRAKTIGLGWPLPEKLTEQDLYNKLFLPTNSNTRCRPLPNWETIHSELRKKGITLQLLWREYREQYPNGVGYSMFCHYYMVYKKTINPIMRQKHKAGEKTFVDYSGMRLEWINLHGEIFPVENAVKIVEMQILAPLRHRTFSSLAEINAEIKIRNLALNRVDPLI